MFKSGTEWGPFAIMVILLLASNFSSRAETITSASRDLTVTIDAKGAYQVLANAIGWQLKGNLPNPAQIRGVRKDKDAVGDYQEISFTFMDAGLPMTGSIRLYEGKDLILFSQTCPEESDSPPSAFPNFTTLPIDHFLFSYGDVFFAPPHFDFERTSGPCLLFDQQDHALVISPASHFICASLVGDGKTQLGSGFNRNLKNIPAGFTQQTLLAVGQGINHIWDTWGHALTDLQGKKRPANDADAIVKYYGYWTDNGAAYWYNYDKSKGYQGTLQALVDSYRAKQIPLGYLQLDSWWYHKTLTQPNGKQGGPKNPALPEGDWNRYGGTFQYKAHPFIFPNGLEAFHENVKLPFITHNRWIDPASPYHDRYKISGIAAIDPGFWNEIATYLKESGVIAYEQDWISDILSNSPELSSTVDQGDAFFDGMANACKEQGLSVQYCMATPRVFLEGSRYDNLTTIRVADDRFESGKYRHFLYTSRLAYSLGIWPWTDVYNSTEITNLLLSTLSSGPVGTGDAMGRENKDNLMKAMRADGVIVKPDVPLVPTDGAYLAEAQKQDIPIMTTTYTDHDGLKTIYGAAVKSSKTAADELSVNSRDLGCTGPSYFYSYFEGTGKKLEPGDTLSIALHGRDCNYFVIAPIGASGIAFLGDADKFVGTGRKRISSLHNDDEKLVADVLFAENESEVDLQGYASTSPQITVQAGEAGPVRYDSITGIFSVTVKPDMSKPSEMIEGDPSRKITVTLWVGKTTGI